MTVGGSIWLHKERTISFPNLRVAWNEIVPKFLKEDENLCMECLYLKLTLFLAYWA
jgi:hypothetical protein